jgi:hypothetical protein
VLSNTEGAAPDLGGQHVRIAMPGKMQEQRSYIVHSITCHEVSSAEGYGRFYLDFTT